MITIAPGITLRPATPEDAPFQFALYASTRQAELDAWGWPAPLRESFLKMQFQAREGYRAMFPKAEFQIIQRHDRPVGQLIVNRGEDEFRLVDIALLPEQCGAGLGSMLIQSLIAEARAAGKPLRLTVLKGHRAATLYQRLGFKKVAETELHDEMETGPLGLPV